MDEIKCQKCGYSWTPKVEHPASCPACKSYTWDKPRKGVK